MTSPPNAIAPSLTVPVMRIDWPIPKTVVLLTPWIKRAFGSFGGGATAGWAATGAEKSKKEKVKRKKYEPRLFLFPFSFFLVFPLFNEFDPMVVGDEPREQRNRDQKNERDENSKSVWARDARARNHSRDNGHALCPISHSSQEDVERAGGEAKKSARRLKDQAVGSRSEQHERCQQERRA